MRAENPETVNCPSCGSALIGGLRFCRMCGYRLGEGLDEYVPTQRLDPAAAQPFAPPRPTTDPFAARQTWGAAPIQPAQPFGAPAQQSAVTSSLLSKACSTNRGGLRWLWTIIVLMIVLSVGGAALKAGLRAAKGGTGEIFITKSFLGVDGLENAPGGGAMITGIAAPDTPAVRAGLIGGDIVKSFDGKPVEDAGAVRDLLANTPAGKTVEVVYVRDGVEAKTVLTTIATKDNPEFRAFDQRPGGRGDIGVNRRDLDRVSVPGTNLFGAELGSIDRNGPADMSGLRKGDVVIKFGEFPIRTPGDLRYRIYEALPGTTVNVTVVRGSEQLEIPVRIGRSKD
jgi:membrane-associated protease RseP (regulator of RpoE activity)